MVDFGSERQKCRRILQRIEPWSLAFDKGHALAERMRHDQDIGKQDRSIETEAADRLQCDLRRPFGVEF